MIPVSVSHATAVARADFLQRIRSRRLLFVLAIFAFVGYQLNVGAFELLYQDTVAGEIVNYRGEPTSAYVGLTTGVTAATVLLFFGYSVLGGSIERDRTSGVDELVASTPIRDRSYLLGKWLSHVGMSAVLLATLGFAALINHVVHGSGPTNPVWILGGVVAIGVPIGCFVSGVTVLFQSSSFSRGTFGTIAYFFGAMTLLTAVLAVGTDPSAGRPSIWLRLADSIGVFAAGEMTFAALLDVAPGYDGPPVANYGTGTSTGETVRYRWDGGAWPPWFVLNRFGFGLVGLALVLFATIPYERFSRTGAPSQRSRFDRLTEFLAVIFGDGSVPEPDTPDPAAVSLRPVTDRDRSGFGRLLVQELRLLLRGHPWWWYAGAGVIAVVGLNGAGTTGVTVAIAAMWPLFVWSPMGYRPIHHRIVPLVVSAPRPQRQLLAEWIAGAIVAGSFLGVVYWPTVLDSGFGGLIVLAGFVCFVPSLAQCLGSWTGTRRAFELSYLLCWYVGPLNGVPMLDFAGATGETVGTATPLAFGVVGLTLFLGAMVHRHRLS
ncbi:ABC transporter permease [Halovivax cerinus]|uniref:ABC transporter permease n=1 Tax=Halovivax cerinus TaxID=1487865 RepID=A0ABD5NQ38_9EURY|nr:ABC transporter permease subunit [Halovivax cerinus]